MHNLHNASTPNLAEEHRAKATPKRPKIKACADHVWEKVLKVARKIGTGTGRTLPPKA